MPKTVKTVAEIFILFLLPWLTGWLFLQDFGTPKMYADSSSYLMVENQLRDNVPMDTTVRTPAYPIFLYTAHALFGDGSKPIVYGQTILTGLTYILCFFILKRLIHSDKRSFICVLLLGFNFNVLAFQNTLLSENLSIFLVVLSLFFHLLLEESFSYNKLLLSLLANIALVMVRPVFVGLPFVLYCFHIFIQFLDFWGKRKSEEFVEERVKHLISYGIALFSICLLLFLYAFNNYVKFEYFGLSRIGDINTLGKLAQYGFLEDPKNYVDPAHPEFSEAFNKIKRGYVLAAPDNKNPWEIMHKITWSYSPEAIADVDKLPQFMSFVLKRNWLMYAIRTLDLTPQIFREYPFYYSPVTFDESNLVYRVFVIAFSILRPGFYLLCGYIFILELFKGNKKLTNKLAFVLLIIAYVVFATAFLAYSEYSRIRIPVELLMDITIFFTISYVVDHNFVLFSRKKKHLYK